MLTELWLWDQTSLIQVWEEKRGPLWFRKACGSRLAVVQVFGEPGRNIVKNGLNGSKKSRLVLLFSERKKNNVLYNGHTQE